LHYSNQLAARSNDWNVLLLRVHCVGVQDHGMLCMQDCNNSYFMNSIDESSRTVFLLITLSMFSHNIRCCATFDR
jgi:hypothetical protein